jgi:hypothetical protein
MKPFRAGFHKNSLFVSVLLAPSAPPIRQKFLSSRKVLGDLNGNL